VLLSTAYFPPVSWFAALAKEFTLSKDGVFPSRVRLEACESYLKQTYRNRCRIYSSSGVEDLVFPIVHDGSKGISEIRVDYSVQWLLRTKRAIDSAYHTSAFFDYYRDELYAILDRRPERLWDLNLSIIRFFMEKTGVRAEIIPTESWVPPTDGDADDLRYVIHPKRPNSILADLGLDREYFQVFSPKYGFKGDLSVMDLLFNEGPSSITYLKRIPKDGQRKLSMP